jgi:HD-GYP domain-containing protein (c-di-GMP phosphodiesterase class II)
VNVFTVRGVSHARAAWRDELAHRAAALGFPMWQAAPGAGLSPPVAIQGLSRLWFSASAFTRAIERSATFKTLDPTLPPEEIFPGAFLLCVHTPREEASDPVRYALIACVLTPEVLDSEQFMQICQSAQLDAPSTRAALSQIVLPTRTRVERAAMTCRWMASDLAFAASRDAVASSFTNELSSSYETIDLLYTLGRSIGAATPPDEFLTSALREIHATLPVGWIGALFLDVECLPVELRGRDWLWGIDSKARDELQPRLRALVEQQLAANVPPTSHTICDGTLVSPHAGSQVIVQRIAIAGRPAGAIVAGAKYGDDPQVSSFDTQLIQSAAILCGQHADNASLYDMQRRSFLGTLAALTSAIDAKDPYTRGHSERVAHLAQRLSLALGDSLDAAEGIRIAGVVHDVGKIGVPERVLLKAGRLTDEEFEHIKRHPEIGHTILRDIPSLQHALPGVLHHHERWDGRGYPHKLAGEAIPRVARILALADTFDAMSSNRAYRAGLSRDKVLEEIKRCAGSQFDPEMAPVFVTLDFTEYDEMVARAAAQSAYDAGPEAHAA